MKYEHIKPGSYYWIEMVGQAGSTRTGKTISFCGGRGGYRIGESATNETMIHPDRIVREIERPGVKEARMNAPLQIINTHQTTGILPGDPPAAYGMDRASYLLLLSNLVIAQSNLIKNTRHDKAWTHYVALCKEIERVGGFTYAPYEEQA